jgi:hypothetical protein
MRRLSYGAVAALALVLSACGGGQKAAGTTAAATTGAAPAASNAAPTAPASTQPSGSPGALTGEAKAAAAGDIPDNQVFVTYSGPAFSMKMPEGWTRTGNGNQVTFRDKNNIIRVVIQPGGAPSVPAMKRELASLRNAQIKTPPTQVTIGGVAAVKAVYTTKSAPNPVTGKTVTLIVDRYELAKNGKRAIIDLGSPVGVDNVDAYRMIVQSFRLK